MQWCRDAGKNLDKAIMWSTNRLCHLETLVPGHLAIKSNWLEHGKLCSVKDEHGCQKIPRSSKTEVRYKKYWAVGVCDGQHQQRGAPDEIIVPTELVMQGWRNSSINDTWACWRCHRMPFGAKLSRVRDKTGHPHGPSMFDDKAGAKGVAWACSEAAKLGYYFARKFSSHVVKDLKKCI